MGKRDFGTTKCLLHFDFPYFNEPNEGLDDEVGLETWVKTHPGVNLCGSDSPAVMLQAPKFGYRCLSPYIGSARCTNNTGIWNLNSSKDYEIEFLFYADKHGGMRDLLSLLNGNRDSPFYVSLDTSGYIVVAIPSWGIESATSSAALSTGGWRHVLLRVSNNTLKVFIDKIEVLSQPLIPDIELSVDNVLLGRYDTSRYSFSIDEFVFRHSAGSGTPTIPTHPYSGRLDIAKIGGYTGYGTINSGHVHVTSDTQLYASGFNASAMIEGIIDTKTFTISAWSDCSYTAAVGCEVLIHITAPKYSNYDDYPLVGLYAFAQVSALDDTTITLSEEITTANGYDFTLDSSLLGTYRVQVIVVPLFTSLVIDADAHVTIESWSTYHGGGIAAFRVTNDCTINGRILTHGKGAIRSDWCQMTNAKLIDRFLCSEGGGVFISCGGTLTIPSTARLGASWSGAGENGNGAAGYGGKGGDANPSSTVNVAGGAGGVGGGGGGAASYSTTSYATGGDVGSNGSDNAYRGSGGGGCGGNGGTATDTSYGVGGYAGGGQGNSGGTAGTGGASKGGSSRGANGGAYSSSSRISAGGGGGPGGSGGGGRYVTSGSKTATLAAGTAGASIILIAKKLNAHANALSTGGKAGTNGKAGYAATSASGGGGTGFCYIACEEQVN